MATGCSALPAAPAWAQAAPASVASSLPPEEMAAWQAARLQGSGRLTYFGLHVYDASLWVQPGWQAERYAQTPLLLELRYARSLPGGRIADRSLTEMQRSGRVGAEQGPVWLAQMKALFPDVQAGDRLTGWLLPNEGVRFFFNAQARGTVRDAVFAELFFGIWLAPTTSEPALRAALLGTERRPPA
ncbi:MAG: chalcone isomerase family protein [Pseudomonadota bacterium]